MKIGKLKTDLLEKYIFDKLVSNRKEVIMGGGTGLDNAVMDFGGDLIVASTDPITGASKNLGSLAINISVNDVSCQCADPVGVLMTLLIPPTADIDDLKEIVNDATRTAEELNVDIVGGHTEVTDAVNKIVISTTVIGRVNKDRRPDIKNVKPGDVLAVSKYLGIEGTSIIAHEKNQVKEILSEEEYEFAKSLSKEISVLKESKIAGKYSVKHMHDITEGGLFGAVWETSRALGHGIRIYNDLIPLLDVTRKISDFYKINPMKLISSGSMLMVFDKENFDDFKKEAEEKGIKVTKIGEINGENEAVVKYEDKEIILGDPDPDELYKVV